MLNKFDDQQALTVAQDQVNQPIVFIGHSMGGLVIAKVRMPVTVWTSVNDMQPARLSP